jgi:hypothetical protein
MSVVVFNENVDKVVVESVMNGVRVCGVLMSVGDYGEWGMDGNWDRDSELNKFNGVEVISDVVCERNYDGISIERDRSIEGEKEWVMCGWINGEVERICRLDDLSDWSDIRIERVDFVDSVGNWMYEYEKRNEREEDEMDGDVE